MASNAPLRGDAERGALNVADPAPPASPRTAAKSAMLLQIGLLGFFTLTRAIHPLIIGKTKVGGKYPHEPITVPLMECILTLVVAQAMTLMNGGLEQWKASMLRSHGFDLESVIACVAFEVMTLVA